MQWLRPPYYHEGIACISPRRAQESQRGTAGTKILQRLGRKSLAGGGECVCLSVLMARWKMKTKGRLYLKHSLSRQTHFHTSSRWTVLHTGLLTKSQCFSSFFWTANYGSSSEVCWHPSAACWDLQGCLGADGSSHLADWTCALWQYAQHDEVQQSGDAAFRITLLVGGGRWRTRSNRVSVLQTTTEVSSQNV